MRKNIPKILCSLLFWGATLPLFSACSGDGSTQEETDTLKQTEEEEDEETEEVGATYKVPASFQV